MRLSQASLDTLTSPWSGCRTRSPALESDVVPGPGAVPFLDLHLQWVENGAQMPSAA